MIKAIRNVKNISVLALKIGFIIFLFFAIGATLNSIFGDNGSVVKKSDKETVEVKKELGKTAWAQPEAIVLDAGFYTTNCSWVIEDGDRVEDDPNWPDDGLFDPNTSPVWRSVCQDIFGNDLPLVPGQGLPPSCAAGDTDLGDLKGAIYCYPQDITLRDLITPVELPDGTQGWNHLSTSAIVGTCERLCVNIDFWY